MNADNTQEPATPSPASAGSHWSPVAWAVYEADGHCVGTYAKQEHAQIVIEELSCDGMVYEPLYRQPTLTDEEREAIAGAMWDYGQYADELGLSVAEVTERQATLRGLLERTK
jgi:hypothetical protein